MSRELTIQETDRICDEVAAECKGKTIDELVEMCRGAGLIVKELAPMRVWSGPVRSFEICAAEGSYLARRPRRTGQAVESDLCTELTNLRYAAAEAAAN